MLLIIVDLEFFYIKKVLFWKVSVSFMTNHFDSNKVFNDTNNE